MAIFHQNGSSVAVLDALARDPAVGLTGSGSLGNASSSDRLGVTAVC